LNCHQKLRSPLVSVVVPSYNRAPLLARTLRGVLAQEFIDLEVVVVDDGSTDDTAGMLANADTRVRVIRNQRSEGVSAARNRGVAAARGEWIAFCDDDDLWSPHKLIRQLEAADGAGAGWVYAGDVHIDAALRVLSGGPPLDPEAVLARMSRSNPLPSGSSNVLVRTSVLASIGGFDPTLRRTEDWDLWIRLARTGSPGWVREPLVAYSFHAGNVVTHPGEMVNEARRLAARYGIPVDVTAMHRRAAWASLRGGRRLRAVGYYARAIGRGDVRSVGRAAVAAVHPAVGSNRLFRFLGRDADWIAQAERWLGAFARTEEQRNT
jgi:glycosyltransferase involved in cell wall biosynthesis